MYEREILENFQEPVIVIDKDGNIVYSNPAFDNYNYFSSLDMESLLNEILSLKYLKEGISVKNYIVKLEGFSFLVDVYPLEENLYTILIKDISRLVRLEEELKKEGTLSTISKFLVELFHDIKGPITGIKAASQFLKQNPEELEVLDDILYEVKRIEDFINGLSSLAKPIRLNLEYENIHKVIDKILKKYKIIYEDIKFERIYDPSLPDIPIDKEKISTVIENLIKNGIDAINQKGKIVIYTGLSNDPIFSPKMNKVSIKIQDSGKGIPKELVDKIFLPYFTTKQFGSGIGLANAYNIVKNHKGVLRYIGNSTFEIVLPIRMEIESNNF
jgi:two-component system nitrogen regulation sensor histidine kinase GlnL